MKRLVLLAACLALAGQASSAEETTPAKTYRSDHAVVSYTVISEDYAKAITRTVEAARNVAVEQFGFDMPETITIKVHQGKHVRLFNDGQDRFSLTVRSEADLEIARARRALTESLESTRAALRAEARELAREAAARVLGRVV